MKSLKDVKPGDKIFVLNSNRGYLKEPQIEILTVRDQHKCIYCGNRVDPGEKFHHEHNGIKSDQIEYGVLLCMDCHTERHHGKKCNDVKEYCRKYLINLYGESIYSK